MFFFNTITDLDNTYVHSAKYSTYLHEIDFIAVNTNIY